MNTALPAIDALRAQLYARTVKGKHFPDVKPLISHYCSTATLEAILRYEQIWFSNPLLMNDLEELRFGMLTGRERFRSHEGLRNVFSSRQLYDAFRNQLEHCFDGFAREGAFDVYIACFAEHQPDDRDGLLSMWRGYGANGNGACIVFDTSKLNEVQESPLIIGKVEYADRDTRIRWVDGIPDTFCELFAQGQWKDDDLKFAAWVLFERLLVFSLYTKHQGFHEEQEWRLTYMKHRDSHDLLSDMLDYHIGPRGIEPKLKFKIKPLAGATDSSTFIDSLVHNIILGPTASADIHRLSVERMLKNIGRQALISRVVSSTIPFRSH
ncbi:DUF2971 domain-containing protein [Paraburkholderia panacisoli]|uniref:DUF2971 domain-containing protein n=1 Tax=Paraburkholderia panacisoli TaxID=2603818 RepID=A0A5B0FXZ6_9BURK|nr:DUF2971 domain-containing protein [Paraburkholderia panacisoli]KAA0996167.1 DUF2971 domain-containing protein [Paraburkholderia panacisoli]